MKKYKSLLMLLIPVLFSAPGVAQEPSQPQVKTVKSLYSAKDTMNKLRQSFNDKGMKIFTVIDHQAAAQEYGLAMPFASVIIFGDPKVGTPMMLAAPTLAIDLPLKALVWENDKGEVFVSVNNAETIGEKHGLSKEVYGKLNGAEKLVFKTVTE
ncbi:DUF302 domain-containing protein [Pasteurellaceae bacterium LIM206]|nr:DUF302 domain-containing protein [Pasteurellaceae bacterium LIM206]